MAAVKPIIEPVDRKLLHAELTPERLLRNTNRAGNEVYVVGPDSPAVLREIGRLREIAFRHDGGGTGEPLDLDKFDTDPAYGYRQLVLWNPDTEEIIGGYRFCLGDDAVYDRSGQPILTSSHMFEFSRRFIREYLPYTLELGRSFVSVDYQSSRDNPKSLYALDNLFDGIMAIAVLYKDRVRFLFGKMTIYQDYDEVARQLVMYFLRKYFGGKGRLLRIRKEVKMKPSRRLSRVFSGGSFKEDYKILKAEVAKRGVSIPPLVNTYMNLSPSMIYFGTGINDEFADVLDSGILITLEDIYPEKKQRHADSFLKEGLKAIRARLHWLIRKG